MKKNLLRYTGLVLCLAAMSIPCEGVAASNSSMPWYNVDSSAANVTTSNIDARGNTVAGTASGTASNSSMPWYNVDSSAANVTFSASNMDAR